MLPKYDTPIEEYLRTKDKKRSTRTFKIDWENGRLLSKTIEGKKAIAQAIEVRMAVELYESEIMPETFGIALKELYDSKGDPMPRDYVLANLRRIIAETIAPDLRIKKISDFTMDARKNSVICYIEVECEDGITASTEVEIKDV